MKHTALIATVAAFAAATGSAQAMNRATPHRHPAAHSTSSHIQQYRQGKIAVPGRVYVQ